MYIMESQSMDTHYYKNDFARHNPNINGGSHKIIQSRKMPMIFGGECFHLRRRSLLTVSQNTFTEADILLMEAVRIAHLVKSIYGGGHKITVS